MKTLCPVSICDCRAPFQTEQDWPVLNLSAEMPDVLLFTSTVYDSFDPYQPPPLGNGKYYAKDCNGVEYSVSSQEIADLLAKYNAYICQKGGGGGATYMNYEQTATVSCSDGTQFSFTCPAGMFGAASLGAANSAALAYAQQQASLKKICYSQAAHGGPPPTDRRHGNPALHATPGWICLGEDLDPTYNRYSISGGSSADYTFAVTTGTLPPGVTLAKVGGTVAELQGTPTTAGKYTWQVTATSSGTPTTSASINDALAVFGFNTKTLADATCGTAYSQQITAEGGTEPISYSISGSLPTGLTLSASGLISGTPIGTGDYSFDVTITDADGGECSETMSIKVNDRTGVCFSSGNPPDGEVGTAYSFTIVSMQPANPAYIFEIASGSLPLGLSLHPDTGVISGTPLPASDDTTYTFTVSIDGVDCPCEATYSVTIKCHPTVLETVPATMANGDIAYFVQRTLPLKDLKATSSGLWQSKAGGSTDWRLRLYDDETNTLITDLAANSVSGGGGTCATGSAALSSTYSKTLATRCLRYRLEARVITIGCPLANITWAVSLV